MNDIDRTLENAIREAKAALRGVRMTDKRYNLIDEAMALLFLAKTTRPQACQDTRDKIALHIARQPSQSVDTKH